MTLGRVIAVAAVLLPACGSPESATSIDAPSSLAVQVIAPAGGEILYPAEPTIVRWSATEPSGSALHFDVELVGDDQTVRALATGVTGNELTWTPVGVAAPTSYRIRVTAFAESGGMASDESDAAFTLSPPAQGVSFARDVQPIFTARCTTQFCHDTASQVAVLHLAPGAAYDQLVNVPSRENPCTSYLRVRPGMPSQSYLVFKVEGSGPCFYGVRMPKNAAALSSAQITTIRDWIAAGASNN